MQYSEIWKCSFCVGAQISRTVFEKGNALESQLSLCQDGVGLV